MLGELQTSVMLGRAGPKAAAGWDGDRYAVFEGPAEQLGLVWFSTWDSEDDAREFAPAYARYQTKRMGKDGFQPEQIPDSLWRCMDNVCQVVERRGRDVAVIEGFAPAATETLLESAFKAKKTEFRPSACKESQVRTTDK